MLEKRRLRRAAITDLGRDYREDKLLSKAYTERTKINEHTLQQGTRVIPGGLKE